MAVSCRLKKTIADINIFRSLTKSDQDRFLRHCFFSVSFGELDVSNFRLLERLSILLRAHSNRRESRLLRPKALRPFPLPSLCLSV